MVCSPLPPHRSSQMLLVLLPEVTSSGWPKHRDEFQYRKQRLLVPLVLPHSFSPAILS